MNEERLKVLKMLKEGRITMEEAELLLDALGASGETRAGHEPSQGAEQRSEEDDRSSERTGWSHGHGFFSGWGGKPGGLFNSEWKLDPKFFESGLKEAMKGFEQSMREFASEFKKRDFPGGFKEFFGRSSGQASQPVRIAAAGATNLVINNRWGDVRIGGTAANEIGGTAAVTAWGPDGETASEIAESVQIEHYREGETIFLHCEIPDSSDRTRFRVDLDLAVPAELGLQLKGMSGDYSVSDLTSGVSAANLSGDIIVQRTTGVMSLESKSGDIEVLGCEGELRAHSLSGDLTLEEIRSVMVQARTVSGDIAADVRPDGVGEVELRSTSGDVRARFPEDAGLEVVAETVSGELIVDLPVEFSEKTINRASGLQRGGGTKVRIQSKSGDISLKRL